jgi:hypothetical protein
MKMKKVLDEISAKEDAGVFVKVGTAGPRAVFTPSQKVQLNRRANELFNAGLIEEARRIYATTGYSDGLSRVADTYMKKGNELEALRLYLQAHNQRNSEPLLEKLARVVSKVLQT